MGMKAQEGVADLLLFTSRGWMMAAYLAFTRLPRSSPRARPLLAQDHYRNQQKAQRPSQGLYEVRRPGRACSLLAMQAPGQDEALRRELRHEYSQNSVHEIEHDRENLREGARGYLGGIHSL